MTIRKTVTTLVDMSADLDRATAMLGLRSRLVELAVHGETVAWSVLIDGELVPIECASGMDEDGAVIISFFLANAPADSDAYHLHADGVFIRSEEGPIHKGKRCRLRIKIPVEVVAVLR